MFGPLRQFVKDILHKDTSINHLIIKQSEHSKRHGPLQYKHIAGQLIHKDIGFGSL